MSREILTRVKVEKTSYPTEYGVMMTTTSVDTDRINGHPIKRTTIEERRESSIVALQTELSMAKKGLILRQTGSLALGGTASAFAAGEAISIFNRGSIDTESVSKTVIGTALAFVLARLSARLNGRRNTVEVQLEAAEMLRSDPTKLAEVERRRKKRRTIGFKNSPTPNLAQ